MFGAYTDADLLGKKMVNYINRVGVAVPVSPCLLHDLMDTLLNPARGFRDRHPSRAQNISHVCRSDGTKKYST